MVHEGVAECDISREISEERVQGVSPQKPEESIEPFGKLD